MLHKHRIEAKRRPACGPSDLSDLCVPGLPGCLKVMIRKGGELFNQSPNPARRRRRVAKGKGNWSVTTA